jgi:hypothetical protein
MVLKLGMESRRNTEGAIKSNELGKLVEGKMREKEGGETESVFI